MLEMTVATMHSYILESKTICNIITNTHKTVHAVNELIILFITADKASVYCVCHGIAISKLFCQ